LCVPLRVSNLGHPTTEAFFRKLAADDGSNAVGRKRTA